MDPPQRVTLEVCWEALEHAGISPKELAGTDAGVFIGVGSDDYGRRLLEDLPGIEAWSGIGASPCAVANRVSYLLDLRGPSLSLDTACSSALVAINQACHALTSGEAPLALAGGVMLVAGPGLSVVLDAAGAISPDGRSKAFDDSADGYGRGEGCGVVVLKPVRTALSDGDRILAVIRGTAVHQDGRTDGIMSPSREAQEHLLRRAYARAGVATTEVDYIEAHGTGTRAGDPVEAAALGAVIGSGRSSSRPCLIGSVKSNIGHLEAGAGAAGVIKTVLALRHGRIPPTLLTTEPSSQVDWQDNGLQLVTCTTPWPDNGHPRRAGVASYGYGGTIAHTVLEEAPPSQPSSSRDDSGKSPLAQNASLLLPISSMTGTGLAATAERLLPYVEDEAGPGLEAMCATLACRRSHLRERAVLRPRGRSEAADALRALVAGEEHPALIRGRSPGGDAAARPVWVFSGHGAQWEGMGRELIAENADFAEAIDGLEPVYRAEAGYSLRTLLEEGPLDRTDRMQAAIYAVQVGLQAVWRSYGVEPAAVIGHSVGEIAAAVAAGVLDELDGARLACRRSALLPRVAGRGAMAMVGLSFAEAAERLSTFADVDAAVAASGATTVISGSPEAIETVTQWCAEERIHIRRVESDVAFHSRSMDPLCEELASSVSDLRPAQPAVPLYTTALDDPRKEVKRDGSYWAANLRNPVRFHGAVEAAIRDGHRTFLEVSSHPVVAHSIEETLVAAGVEEGSFVAHSLRRNKPQQQTLLHNLVGLHCHGTPVKWNSLYPRRELVDLPTTAWQHEQFWAETTGAGDGLSKPHDPASHTLLGGQTLVRGASRILQWRTILDDESRPFPGRHPVQGIEIIPAAVLLATFFTAGAEAADRSAWPSLRNVSLRTPVPVGDARAVQVVHQDRTLTLSSRLLEENNSGNEKREWDNWATHTTALVGPPPPPQERPVDSPEAGSPLDPDHVVTRLAELQVAGMGFPWRIDELRGAEGTLTARVTPDPNSELDGSTWPSVLDAALSIASVVFPGPPVLRMPTHIDEAQVTGPAPERAVVEARMVRAPQQDGVGTVEVAVRDEAGTSSALLCGLSFGALETTARPPAAPATLLHELVWSAHEPPTEHQRPLASLHSVGENPALESTLRTLCEQAGIAFASLGPTMPHRSVEADAVVLLPPPPPEREPDHATVAAEVDRMSMGLIEAIQVVAEADGSSGPRLWCLTTGVREAQSLPAAAQAPLWGIGRICASEYPDLWGGILDLPIEPTDLDLATVLRLLNGTPPKEVLAIREGVAQTVRLKLARTATNAAEEAAPTPQSDSILHAVPAPGPEIVCSADGSYLIRGGLGALGLRIAQWLATRGARRLILLSRRSLPPRTQWGQSTEAAEKEAIDTVLALESAGVTVQVLSADVCNRDQMKRLLDQDAFGLPPVRGVVHAAGVNDNRFLRACDKQALHAVTRPKVSGTLVLHELFPPGSVDFLVLFSSVGQLLGLPGQSLYAAANAFLDAMAHHRRTGGATDTVSMAWTSWRGLGMSTSSDAIDAELEARGTADITPEEALAAWELASGNRAPHLAVLRLLPDASDDERPSVLKELAAPQPSAAQGEEEDSGPGWSGLSEAELRSRVREVTATSVGATLGVPPETLEAQRPLSELGMDSIMTVALRRRLQQHTRVALPANLLWGRPTVAAISELLVERLAQRATSLNETPASGKGSD